MLGTILLEVSPKKGVFDPVAHHLLADIRHLGVRQVKGVSTALLYRLVGELTPEERSRISGELLHDPLLQEVHDGGREACAGAVTIDIWLKSGVTDVVAESVLKGLRDMGISGVSQVRTGTRYQFQGLRDKGLADRLTLSLLANPLIHDRVIHAG